jgi:hypothetical protein
MIKKKKKCEVGNVKQINVKTCSFLWAYNLLLLGVIDAPRKELLSNGVLSYTYFSFS